jgi:hypothetical protein
VRLRARTCNARRPFRPKQQACATPHHAAPDQYDFIGAFAAVIAFKCEGHVVGSRLAIPPDSPMTKLSLCSEMRRCDGRVDGKCASPPRNLFIYVTVTVDVICLCFVMKITAFIDRYTFQVLGLTLTAVFFGILLLNAISR